MNQQFKVRFYTLQSASNPKTAESLWRMMDDPLISPKRFDANERTRQRFRSDTFVEAAQIYQERGSLTIRGGHQNFLAVLRDDASGLASWSFWLNIRALESKNRSRWLNWFYELCGTLPILFGLGCSTDEYDAKHLDTKVFPSGVTRTGSIGTSTAEFYRYLPGVYWLTVFGEELVRSFGHKKLMTLPGTIATSLDNGQIALCLDEPVVPEELDIRLETERRLATQIGDQYFFDRGRPTDHLKPVPALYEALRSRKSVES